MKAVPIKQGHNLGVSWPVTPSIHYYEEGPSRYLGHLIGHEGGGSLFHALKNLGRFSLGHTVIAFILDFYIRGNNRFRSSLNVCGSQFVF